MRQRMILAGILAALPTCLHAQITFDLAGTYRLDGFEADGNNIAISFSGWKNIPVCRSDADYANRLEMLRRIRAGNREIDIHVSRGSPCLADIAATPGKDERIPLVEDALKSVLPNAAIRLRDFDRLAVENSNSPFLTGETGILYVPYDKLAVREMTVNWRTTRPGEPVHYYVSIIGAYRNTPDDTGHEEFTQGAPDFEALPYISSRIDPSLLGLVRAIDRQHGLGLLRVNKRQRTDILILDKPDAWLVKRIEFGACTGDRSIRILRIDKAGRKPQLPVRTEELAGGECPC